ncbi:MAG: LPD5 domain-containing protein [Sulfuricaulis sp.]
MRDAMGADVAADPLSKSWPEPDYGKLIEAGTDPWVAAFVHSARDEIPPKPRQSWRLRGWIDNTTALRGFSNDLLNGKISKEQVQEKLNDPQFARLKAALIGRIDLYQAVGHEQSLKGVRVASGSYSIFNGKEIDPPKVIWSVEKKSNATAFSNWPTMLSHGDTREEAIANFKKSVESGSLNFNKGGEREASFDIYSYRSGEKAGKYYIGKKIGKNYVDLESFNTAKEARAYMAVHRDDLTAKLDKLKYIPNERKDSNAPRVGADHRDGADVTPDRFSESFGFRGVQFGNYVEGGKRQHDLNEAYDALMDMAGVLNVPPKALSLNGELGLAFGARGTGAAGYGRGNTPKVHYESGQVVINLTKNKGAGSLAHEWWHALDNYFSRRRGEKEGYLTEKARPTGEGVRPEMVEAFKNVIQTVTETGLKERSSRLDKTRTKPYWSTGREMTARAFESYVIEKLHDQGASNDYLANIVSEDYWRAASALGLEKEGTYPYPEAAESPAVRAAFDKFFRTVETKETDKGVAMFSPDENMPREQGQPMFDQTGAKAQTAAHEEAPREETPEITPLRKAVESATGKPFAEGSFTNAGVPDAFRGVAQAVKDIFGKNVVFFHNHVPDKISFGGIATAHDTKNIYVNAAHSKPFSYVTGHELLHLLKRDRPDIYNGLYQVALKHFRPEMVEAYKQFLTKFKDKNDLERVPDDKMTHEEMLANFTGDNFSRPVFWAKLAKEEPNVFMRMARTVYEYLKSLIANAKMRFGKQSGYNSADYFTDLEKMRDAIGKAMKDYAEHNRIKEHGEKAALENGPERAVPLGDDVNFSTMTGVDEREDTAHPEQESLFNKVLRVPMQALKLDKLTYGAYKAINEFGGKIIPERVKAGVVSDYGLERDDRARREAMFGAQRRGYRQTADLLGMFGDLSRGEAAVLHELGNITDKDRAADPSGMAHLEAYLKSQLRPESVQVLDNIRQEIDKLQQERLKLGLMSEETYERYKGGYLHRDYMKWDVLPQVGSEQRPRERARVISLLADHFQGRGLTEATTMDKIKNADPEFWMRKQSKGEADKYLLGEKFIKFEKRKPRGEGVGTLPGVEPSEQLGRVQETAYWPAAEPIPDKYGDWHRDNNVWEVRSTKGNKVLLWRDFSRAERDKMGEIEDIRYSVAKTLHSIIQDVETGRYLKYMAEKHGVPEADDIPVGHTVADAHEGSRTLKAYLPTEWVQVPESNLRNTKVKKYGPLAGLYVPGPVWNDVRQIHNRSYAPLGPMFGAIQRFWKISKALALDTPIPTPDGWTTMGEIRVGDKAFDEQGQVCEVLGATEVQLNRPCYDVSFSDGTHIVADAEHLWFTIMQKKPGIRTTEEILATLKERTRGDNKHSIPLTDALQLPNVELPIPPYVLGVWLGDGATRNARITAGPQDADEIVAHLCAAGARHGKLQKDKRNGVITFTIRRSGLGCIRGHDAAEMGPKGCRACFNDARRAKTRGMKLSPGTNKNLQVRMREIGLLGHKHIPSAYLRASEQQRRELLKGLMDSDGHITKHGLCGFGTSLPELRDGVMELLRSLGYKPTSHDFIPRCNGKAGKTASKIHFQAYADEPVFHLGRKLARLRQRPETNQRSQARQIIAVTPVPSVPVRCIKVSSESELYLAGPGMVPTHNTALSPTVHMNNTMSNFIFADWHDLQARNLYRGLKLLLNRDNADSVDSVTGRDHKELWQRFTDAGGEEGLAPVTDVRRATLEPLIEELRKEYEQTGDEATHLAGLSAAIQALSAGRFKDAFTALAESKGGLITKKAQDLMLKAYHDETITFRLGAFLQHIDAGKPDQDAATLARDAFHNYTITAPWIQTMRATAWPFISFAYRNVPMMLETYAKKPWKLLKLAMVMGALNSVGYALSGGNEKRERHLLPDEKSGDILGFVGPKEIRMPWNGADKSPLFMDIRRFIPTGDLLDLGETHAAMPIAPTILPGGPLAVLGEIFFNHSMYTGKPITQNTDTPKEVAEKIALDLYQSFMPNNLLIPGTYANRAVVNAGKGKTDLFGREQSVPQSVASSIGVKLAAYPEDVAMRDIKINYDMQRSEIDRNIGALKRQYAMHGMSYDDFMKQVQYQEDKLRQIAKKVQDKVAQ